MPLRIVFCGTSDFALPSLRHLVAQPDLQIVGVVTQPDRPRGRGQATGTPPVKDAALAAGLAVFQPQKIKSEEAFEYFQRVAPDVVVIIAYGQIIPQRLIDLPRLGWINLHGSLLPKYRGAAPVHRAILGGETRTGLTTMCIDAGLDTGPMLLTYETEIAPDETAPELYARLAEAGAPLLADTLRGIESGKLVSKPQDNSQATFAPPLKKEEGRVDWALPAQQIYNRIRALQPWPGTFTSFRGKNCAIWGRPAELAPAKQSSGTTANSLAELASPGTIAVQRDNVLVACGAGSTLRIESVQLEGRKRTTGREFANGARLVPGDRFSD